MVIVRSGITRTVLLVGRWAIKVPRLSYAYGVRGWLANRSECKQFARHGVNPPLTTLGHFATVYRRADRCLSEDEMRDRPELMNGDLWLGGDEDKASSWGWFGNELRLIDYDRAWHHPRGIVGGLYFGHQERIARRLMAEAQP